MARTHKNATPSKGNYPRYFVKIEVWDDWENIFLADDNKTLTKEQLIAITKDSKIELKAFSYRVENFLKDNLLKTYVTEEQQDPYGRHMGYQDFKSFDLICKKCGNVTHLGKDKTSERYQL